MRAGQAEGSQRGVHIADVGSFFAGGHTVTLTNQPKQRIQVARNATERLVDLNGDYITGQCYVQYVKQMAPAFDAPVMFWHGGAMTGVTWETTPDGRPGWQSYFMRCGFDTYVCDAMERGRSGWSPYPEIYDTAPIFRTRDEAWSLFRFGKAAGYSSDRSLQQPFAGLRFPLDHLDGLVGQFVPRWTDHGKQTLGAYYQVLQRVGPVWLVAHSQGGNFALEAAAHYPEYFKGVVLIEPASAPMEIGKAWQVPLLFIWGDYIGKSPTWVAYREVVDHYINRLKQAEGQVDILDLPEQGIRGNSHVPMMDNNSDEVAGLVFDWVCSRGTPD